MLRIITVALLLLATGAPATVQDRLAHPAVDLRGALYRVVMQRARSATDLIYGLLADDLDRVPFVYANTDKHPATFNPDT